MGSIRITKWFLISLLLILSCQHAKEISAQLSFMSSLREIYGGEWNGSALNDCYELEIKNSEILKPESDSLVYYSTLIGRAFVDSLDYNFSCLTLKLVNEDKIFIASKSKSKEFTFDLNLIRRFKKKDLKEYLVIRKAYYAIRNVYQDDIVEARSWIEDINENEGENPYIKLAEAHILRSEGDLNKSRAMIDSLSSTNLNDAELHKYFGLYYSEDKLYDLALEQLHISLKEDDSNLDYLGNVGGMHHKLGNWDSLSYYTSKMLKIDSTDINALYSRAYSSFQLNQTEKGCDDIQTILKLQPQLNLADSIMNYCK